MDLGTALSAAQTLFSALQCSELKKICSIIGYKSQLKDFQRTVHTVNNVLLDAQNRQELSIEEQGYIQELKDTVYDADDLLDEFVTLTKQKQLIKGGKLSEDIRTFFSRNNPLKVAYRMSQGVEKIRKNLDAIAKNHTQFGFSVNSERTRWRREETCSYVYESNIIGREHDVEKIVGHLLNDSNVQQNNSVLTIVGIGGLGKTALAQLIYNDVRVKIAFPLRLWTCVADQDQDQLDVEGVLRKILAADGEHEHLEGYNKERLQIEVRKKLTSNKYLLVLDDLWSECRDDWLKLEEFLLGGQRKSRVLVTTRSHVTAGIVSGLTHELQGLSKENSWSLFEKIAFGSDSTNPQKDLIELGQEIVEGCARVPLAIRVAGSLLYGQKKKKWLAFQQTGLCNFKGRENNIMSILKLSYDQLEPPLKCCFSYCAIFPKDFVIVKERLISLWMAQGYIVPSYDGEIMEDVGEDYFAILLRRCFFQDVKCDEYGEVRSCKIHDLMHDVAQNIAGREICNTNSVTDDKVAKARHVAYDRSHFAQCSFNKTHIRSFLGTYNIRYSSTLQQQFSVEALVENWMCLRLLDLSALAIQSLPHSVGGLLHLRYLDLSYMINLEVLPKSITKLYNLQTLSLYGCYALKELPKDLRKLVNLRYLYIDLCNSLTDMPEGMSKLICLQRLSMFIMEGATACQLEELKKLESLKGKLVIKIISCENAREVKEDGEREGGYMKSKEHLNHIEIKIKGRCSDEKATRLMEALQPHPNLKHLDLSGCLNRITMPSWLTSLSNLKVLTIGDYGIEHLTCLGNLPHLESLYVFSCYNLEYMIEKSACTLAGSSEPTTFSPNEFFPCLRNLTLATLPKLESMEIFRRGGG